MKWYSTYNHPDGIKFIIEHDENVGYFMYFYEDMDCFELDVKRPDGCPNHQDDDLQDTLEIAQEILWEDFQIPLDSWVEVKPSL